jgi:hypothetical protein
MKPKGPLHVHKIPLWFLYWVDTSFFNIHYNIISFVKQV